MSLPAQALALAGALCVFGCATPQTRALLATPPPLPQRVELVDTPFHPQETNQCGPAALATALGAAGVNVAPEALASQVYLPGRGGSLQPEMLGATRRNGLIAYPLAPRLDDVLAEVAAGTPVIVLQNLSFGFAPLWHYAVVIGYDLQREEVMLRSGASRRLVMTLSQFEHTWARSAHWAMLAVPPERLPATADEETYVTAAAGLERTSAEAAHRAYRAALVRWPKNLVARLGLGNTTYAMRDLVAAEAAYRQATLDHPESGDAWNNLAQTLSDLGRRTEAVTAAERAMALGGPRRSIYETTLKDISRGL